MADRNLALQLLITARDQASGVLRGLSGAVQRVGRDAARLVTGFRDVGLAIEGVRTVAGLLARVTGLSARRGSPAGDERAARGERRDG